MGQEVSQETSQYQKQNWKLVQENPQHPLYRINPYCQRCFHNKLTNEYVEEYVLQFASEKDYLTYVQELKFRKEGLQCSVKDQKNCSQMQTFTSPYIYPVKEFVNRTNSSLCSTTYKGLLYMESVDLRLKDINDIPSSDQLYLLASTLEGFQYLYQKVGFFDICEEMIFITSLGKVRVWLNPNLSKMEPFINHKTSIEDQNRQINGSQSDMVSNLINIIESNTLHNNDKIVPFKQYLIDKGIFTKLSFYKALQELQFYCRQNRLYVGDNLNSVYEMHQSIHIDGCQQEQSIAFSQKSKQLADLVNSTQTIIHKNSRSRFSNSIVSVVSKKSIKCSRFAKDKNKKVKKQSIVMNNEATLQRDQFVIKDSLSTHKRLQQICMDSSNHKQKCKKSLKAYTISDYYQANLPSPTQNIDYLRKTKQTNETQINPNIGQETVIKFSYCQVPSHITSKKLNSYGNLNTMITLHTHSQSSYSLKQDILSTQARQSTNKISYYSPQESFTLDSELAQDLKNMLGYKMDDSK